MLVGLPYGRSASGTQKRVRRRRRRQRGGWVEKTRSHLCPFFFFFFFFFFFHSSSPLLPPQRPKRKAGGCGLLNAEVRAGCRVRHGPSTQPRTPVRMLDLGTHLLPTRDALRCLLEHRAAHRRPSTPRHSTVCTPSCVSSPAHHLPLGHRPAHPHPPPDRDAWECHPAPPQLSSLAPLHPRRPSPPGSAR